MFTLPGKGAVQTEFGRKGRGGGLKWNVTVPSELNVKHTEALNFRHFLPLSIDTKRPLI